MRSLEAPIVKIVKNEKHYFQPYCGKTKYGGSDLFQYAMFNHLMPTGQFHATSLEDFKYLAGLHGWAVEIIKE